MSNGYFFTKLQHKRIESKYFLVPPGTSLPVQRNKPLNASVTGAFYIGREIAGRQFAQVAVILQAIAANAFSAAGKRTITKSLIR